MRNGVEEIDKPLENIRDPTGKILRQSIQRILNPVGIPTIGDNPGILLVPDVPQPVPVANPGCRNIRLQTVGRGRNTEPRRRIGRQRTIRRILPLNPSHGHTPVSFCQTSLLPPLPRTPVAVVIKK